MSELTNLRQRLLMDPQWRFRLGDDPQAAVVNHGDTYGSVKAGHAGGPAGKAYDDSSWRPLDLPHDFVLEQPYDPTGNVSHGFRRGAVGWYRKSFDLPVEDLGKQLWLEFDGVFRNCTVWLNGFLLGNHASGYTSFHYDISDVANYGGRNVLAVRVDATEFEGWWYEGGGIYRHVWLSKAPALHAAQWGVFAAATLNDDFSAADVAIETEVANAGEACEAIVTSVLLDPQGNEVASETVKQAVGAHETVTVRQTLPVASPQLWDVETPSLYALQTSITAEGSDVADVSETAFGIRHIRFDPEQGFLLNGRPVKLKGTCNHQDHGGVGIAVPDAVQEYRIRRLLDMGGNAYRCAHNPPAAEVLDACDRLGMLVMDENRHLSSAAWGLADLESMIRRDRNHPSIIMWSMANEEPAQSTEEGTRIVKTMIARTRQLDTTRPTITAMNGGWGGPFSLAHDIQGCNYEIRKVDDYHTAHPEHAILGSEQSSALTTRGIYLTDAAKGYMSAYDVNAPEWGDTAEAAWRPIAERTWMAGTFIWTGFDYRGEPTPYQWPCISSHFGIMDMCGFPKDNFYYYQAWWGSEPVLHILPHWNWPERAGETIPVWVHSNCEEVELFLNGQSLGRQTMERNSHLEWQVVYEPGRLTARGFDGGELTLEASVETTGPAAALRLAPDRWSVAADGEDVVAVACEVVDAEGRVVPLADDPITFAVSEAGRVLGAANGDPSNHEPDNTNAQRAFGGLCQVLVQSKRGQAGTMKLTVTAAGLLPAEVEIVAEAGEGRAFVAAAE